MENERKEPTINDALAELAIIEGNLYAAGAVDAEPTELNRIKQDLIDGKIPPAEAINRARALMSGRQDYH